MSGRIISKPFIIAAGAAAALSGVGGYAWHEVHRPKVLELYVLDLPGGLGLFIRTPNDKRILVNGGSNAEVVKRVTDILPFYSRRIDTIIAANTDGKHVTGLIDVLDRYIVDGVILPAPIAGSLTTSDPISKVFADAIDRDSLSIREVTAGNTLVLDTLGPNSVKLSVLFPAPVDAFKYSKASGPEILFRVDYGSTSIIFMGSAGMKVQKFIAESPMSPADILIFSHSAIPANTSGELIRSIMPRHVVYSRAITRSSAGTGNKSKKAQTDPLAGILKDHRFNTKEKGVIKIMSDGSQTRIEQG